MKLRLARNKDASQIISLIKKCYLDYPNCYLDVENDSPELLNVFSSFKKEQGKFWVYEKWNKIIGCMGYIPSNKNYIEIHKLYIDKNFRNMSVMTYDDGSKYILIPLLIMMKIIEIIAMM